MFRRLNGVRRKEREARREGEEMKGNWRGGVSKRIDSTLKLTASSTEV